MAGLIPDEVNLHAGTEEVSDQGDTMMCKAYAACENLDTLAQRAGFPRGHSPWFLARRAKAEQSSGMGDVGMSTAAIAGALSRFGICMLSDFDPGRDMSVEPGLAANLRALLKSPLLYSPMRYTDDDTILSIERHVCFGRPVDIDINLPDSFHSSIGNSGWRSHNWDARTAPRRHAMTIVGFSRPARRFLAKNSEGTRIGDEGYVGVPYDKFLYGPQYSVNSLSVFEMCPYQPKKVQGFMPGIPTLTKDEARNFATLVQPSLRADLEAAFVAGGGLGLRDECIRRGVSDKLVEEALQLQRGEAQAWFNANGIPRGAMIWLDIA